MSELLPCPFCGGAVFLERPTERPLHSPPDEWWGVVCRNTENLGGTCAIQQRPSRTKEAAIDRWNTRADVSSQAEIERLRTALSKMANEVFGLSVFEVELRSVMGNTNWSVLRQRAEEARAALSGSKE
ncbi:Lar family restriction alleviation protein [Devosia sp. A8/3-2]|nr:Lar family restriction alleviation protein [Devosia sp. A8/3-2]